MLSLNKGFIATELVLTFLFCAFFPTTSYTCDTNEGNGQTIKLLSGGKIQMVSQEISVIPRRGGQLFSATSAGSDKVRYICKYTLKNLDAAKANIKVGLEVENKYLPFTFEGPEKLKALIAYGLLVYSNDHNYKIDYFSVKKENVFCDFFSWEMQFEPNEEKVLLVTYSTPISVSYGTSESDFKRSTPYAKKWYRAISGQLFQYCAYMTQPGGSWVGSITKSEFKFYPENYEDYLASRSFFEGDTKDEQIQSLKEYPAPVMLFYLCGMDKRWKRGKDGHLSLMDYNPDEKDGYFSLIIDNIDITKTPSIVFLYAFPELFAKTKNDALRVVPAIEYNAGVKFTKEDYEDLRDIYHEYNGTHTSNSRANDFAKTQAWYNVRKRVKIEPEVFDYLNEKINAWVDEK